jgi:glutaredoxin
MVRIYTIENCPYCTELKSILTSEGVQYIEINVDLPENEAEFNKLYEFTKCNDVPMVKVRNQLLLPEISFKTIKEAANLTKKFLI